MSVGLSEPENLLPVAGIKLASCASGIKPNGATDTVLLEICEGASTAAVFTQNAFCAAPVTVCKQHLAGASPRALLINSGNANAGTGRAGMQAALRSCQLVASTLSVSAEQVLPFSTGVIGELLPVEKFEVTVPEVVGQLEQTKWLDAARGIMTTDTIAKAVSRQIDLAGQTITITGMSKGSGMICPNMATMLAYVATDAEIEQQVLHSCLQTVVNASFNRITVDGDTSTNDSCVLIATGKSGVTVDERNADFMHALQAVFIQLAQAIIRDGEGATKFISVKVNAAKTEQEARDIAYTIAHSPLVKTAFFASDPNWGRILAAVGRAGLDNLVIEDVRIYLDDVCIVEQGSRANSYTEQQGQSVMNQQEITIRIELRRGVHNTTVWTTDLSHDYVTINSEYRS